MNLEDIRQEINEIDNQLVKLLEKRMELVEQVIAYKQTVGKPILDSSRELAVLERVANLVQNEQYRPTVQATFADIMAQSRAYQATKICPE